MIMQCSVSYYYQGCHGSCVLALTTTLCHLSLICGCTTGSL